MNPSEMPEDVRHALLKILYVTLIHIRGTKDLDLAFALSDHAHNIPDLIDRYTPEKFQYYWKAERACFLQMMERLGQPFGGFDEHWTVLEKHHASLQDLT